jgi:Tol biopolymer transport system component
MYMPHCTWDAGFLSIIASLTLLAPGPVAAADLAEELHVVPYQIVYETWQNGNWELFRVQADGSQPTNLTKTPQINELYPHVCPDGTKVLFSVDEGEGEATVRSVWYMNLDGSERTLVAHHARDACWKGDGTAIAYLPDEFEKFHVIDYATKGLMIYDVQTRQHRPHPNSDLHHLYNICWSPDGRWFVATVHAGMGHGHAILAFPADGTRVYNLNIPGCRPDLSPDGKKICWGASDFELYVADLDLTGDEPKLTQRRVVAKSLKPTKIYHADWSPDGKYITFSSGPAVKRLGVVCEIVGVPAPGWNIGVADANGDCRQVLITKDGASNKEPDWAPLPAK